MDLRESPPDVQDVCPVCQRRLDREPASMRSLFRCQDCPMGVTMCHACILHDHRARPFDRIRRWSTEDECWVKTSTAELGHVVYLGHGGHCCPKIPRDQDGNPDPRTRQRTITVLHEHGIVEMPFVFCRCASPVNDVQQLLAVGLWPATWDTPKTATTLTTLETLHNLSLQAHVNYHDYLEHLKRMTDGVLTSEVPDRYRELTHSMRQYSFVRLCRRRGVTAGSKIPPRTLVVECPACPHPERNVRKNFFKRAKEFIHVDALRVTFDGNFHFNLKWKQTDKNDFPLVQGAGFFVHADDMAKYLKKADRGAKTKETSTCNHFGAMDYGKYKGEVSGIVAVLCRHGFTLPAGVVDLHFGERFVYVDFAVVSALQPYLSLPLWQLIYDIMCQYIIRFKIRLDENFDKDMLAALESIDRVDLPQIIAAVGKYHLSMHTIKCREKFSMHHLPCSCIDDGETCERLWGIINAVARRTKEMSPGHRQDVLNDHFYDQNVKKMHGLVAQLAFKLPKSEEHLRDIQAYVETLEKSIVQQSGEETLKEWKALEAEWKRKVIDIEQHATIVSPYQVPERAGPTIKEIAEHLAEESGAEDATAAAGMASVIHDCLQLEADRLKLTARIAAYSGQESQRSALASSVEGIRTRSKEVEERYALFVQPCIAEATRAVMADGAKTSLPRGPPGKATTPTETDAKRTDIPMTETALPLPSDLHDDVIKHPAMTRLVNHELQFRKAFARNALDDLRMHIITHATVEHRKKQGSGVVFNTGANASIKTKTDARDAARDRYRAIRETLLVLGMDKDDQEFKPLHNEDVRAFVIVSEEELLGDSRRRPSWIWGDFSFIGKEKDGKVKKFMLESLRVHWFRYSALLTRWIEEVDTEREECFRTVKSFKHDMDFWEQHALNMKSKGLLGSAAYARR
ncbi:hypothetical protein L226DRAFT_474379 [Lentinus tigrinus ALCF2SS1-7]|uniref:uncharacterized protein n=1 Tax=Lentinus tigrinus ALCF2SS1-7 TaxID=1328758 RepID=UPI001166244D|nr:hypothetical protein L226DRAFT_474379 [Lentinus tigrinus ALCF2SS1-7]